MGNYKTGTGKMIEHKSTTVICDKCGRYQVGVAYCNYCGNKIKEE